MLPTRLLKFTDENIQTQKALQSSYAVSSASVGPAKGRPPKEGAGAGASSARGGRKTEARGTKRARDDVGVYLTALHESSWKIDFACDVIG